MTSERAAMRALTTSAYALRQGAGGPPRDHGVGHGWPDVLQHPFLIIAFDWDGTAVNDRREEASAVRAQLENLLRLGVRIVVVSGTNLLNVDRQLSASIRGTHKQHLFLCTNRGSEVYGFDVESEPIAMHRRVATPEEDRALDAAAESVRDELAGSTGLEVQLIYDRLNRRKIDLIPVAEWADPPKSQIERLRRATECRLKTAGLGGGLAEVVEMARQAASASGLPDARITSDAKHVEIGLTDKADSMIWVMRELADANRIVARDMLVGGDEFGPVAACPGSDSRMMIPAAADATFVSVGPEPYGVPPGVLHLPGGPARFRELLTLQTAVWGKAKACT